jgi:flagellar protein FlbD
MILLRRLNNAVIGLNADLIERIDSTPDTVITLVDGKKYLVAESPEEVVDRIVTFRAKVLAQVVPRSLTPRWRLCGAEVSCDSSARPTRSSPEGA